MNKSKNPSLAKGFSLAEVMIAAGMIGALAVGFMQMQKNATKTSAEFEGKMDVITTQNEIQQILSNPENCTTTFIGKNAINMANATDKIKFKNNVGTFIDKYKTIILDPTARYGAGGKLKIENYSLSDASNDVAVVADGTTHLLIQFDKGKMAGADSTRKITLKVSVDASNNIVSCVALSNSNDLWSRSTSNPTKIFYSAGNVGVGSTNPAAKLDVAGEVKFGSTGAACNATNEGQQRYNSTIKNMEFCDGANWKIVGDSGASVQCNCWGGATSCWQWVYGDNGANDDIRYCCQGGKLTKIVSNSFAGSCP